MKTKTIICIIGPTASGKTSLSVDVALQLKTEIISADSVQVYRELDIGSAKPTLEERKGVTHHMIDCVDVTSSDFSVSVYKDMAFPIADNILNNGSIPLVVGGSGLYVSVFTNVLSFAAPSDKQVRSELESLFDEDPQRFHIMLNEIDPISASRLHINDRKRLVRAMEIYRITGKPFSSFSADFRKGETGDRRYDPILIGLTMDRQTLYHRIDSRVDQMISDGLVDEAKMIYKKNYDRKLPAMQSIGYKQLFEYFDGTCSFEEAVETIKRDTRHYAKRQMTWFKRDPEITWIDCSEIEKSDLRKAVYQIIDHKKEGLL